MNNEFEVREAEGFKKKDMLNESETILDSLSRGFMELVQSIRKIEISRRKTENVWVIDIFFDNGQIFYLKLKGEETQKRVNEFVQPLVDKIKEFRKKNEH